MDFIKSKVEVKEFDNGGKIIKISIPMDELKRIENNGWVNIDLKKGKDSGKLYLQNNVWKKE